mmetsp:Transcript_10570/g.42717  ORF Transcript_10570/g.42717 Transcript_10570/m.42717 type:complete len:225 (-) Transcript_10570:291-965(-)
MLNFKRFSRGCLQIRCRRLELLRRTQEVGDAAHRACRAFECALDVAVLGVRLGPGEDDAAARVRRGELGVAVVPVVLRPRRAVRPRVVRPEVVHDGGGRGRFLTKVGSRRRRPRKRPRELRTDERLDDAALEMLDIVVGLRRRCGIERVGDALRVVAEREGRERKRADRVVRVVPDLRERALVREDRARVARVAPPGRLVEEPQLEGAGHPRRRRAHDALLGGG